MRISEVIRNVFQIVPLGLAILCLSACAVSQTNGPGGLQPAYDTMVAPGEIQVAETHLRDFGYDPGPVDGVFTAETQAAVRAYQARYGLPVSGLLDRPTRRELLPGFGLLGIFR